jgi:putrescine transport system ATP-binding protein
VGDPAVARDLTEPLLRVDQVVKRFGDFTAVDGVSLDIRHGELFCLLGSSGCGKSTLLRCLAGFEMPSAGRILIDGVDMTDTPPHQRPVNMMFQSYALFPHMSVWDNVAYGLRQERRSRATIRAKVDAMLELVALAPYAKRKPQALSGGQRQRVALARALVKEPKLLLLDEPLAALDRKLREATQFELMNIQARLGITFVVVTHDQEEAMTLATRMAVMEQGRLLQVGTARELYEQPNCRFVADFIGAANIFPGTLRTLAHGTASVDSEHGLLETHSAHTVSTGSPVWVAVRPECIDIDAVPPPTSGPNRVPGTLMSVTFLGDVSVFKVLTAGGEVIKITRPQNSANPHHVIQRGSQVWLTWPAHTAQLLTS